MISKRERTLLACLIPIVCHALATSMVFGIYSSAASTTSITLVYDLLPTQWRGRVLDVLDGWEVVFILLHGRDPWYVVKGHDLHTEVFIVLDLLNFGEEGRQVGSRDVVHVCDEVGRRELMTWSVRYSQDN